MIYTTKIGMKQKKTVATVEKIKWFDPHLIILQVHDIEWLML